MEKKNYVKPSMKVYDLKCTSQILTVSDPDSQKRIPRYDGEGGYLPTIPGMPDDENHLA